MLGSKLIFVIKMGPLMSDWYTLKGPWQNGRHFANYIFKFIFLDEN